VSEYLYRDGDATYDFYVVVSGAVEIVVQADGEERIVARYGPGGFLGELNMLSGQRVYLSARVAGPGEVIVVPADDRGFVLTDRSLGVDPWTRDGRGLAACRSRSRPAIQGCSPLATCGPARSSGSRPP
jgi:hypothetical protein